MKDILQHFHPLNWLFFSAFLTCVSHVGCQKKIYFAPQKNRKISNFTTIMAHCRLTGQGKTFIKCDSRVPPIPHLTRNDNVLAETYNGWCDAENCKYKQFPRLVAFEPGDYVITQFNAKGLYVIICIHRGTTHPMFDVFFFTVP